jgi:hypothetical protein
MSAVKITMQLTDGYQSAVSIERTLELSKPDQPEYGEPGYNTNRKYPSVDWDAARDEADALIDEMKAEYMERLIAHGEKDEAKVRRVNAAKGIKPVEVQAAEDRASEAVDAVL